MLAFFTADVGAVDNLPLKPSAQVTTDFKALEVSAPSGKAPLTVQITGPSNVNALKTNTYDRYVNCGFSVLWGDGEKFPSGQKRGASCAAGFEHIYKKPGLYKIIFLITEPGTTDESKVVWTSERVIQVSQ